MPVKFKAVQRRNPSKPTEPNKWYPQAIANGETKLKDLADYASETSTVSKADILAVLETVLTKVSKDLSDGKIVRVGEYFTLQVSVSGEASDKEEEVNSAKIKSGKILFRPGKMLSDMLKLLSYSKGG
ncbi:MAG: DNA-binding domain-containing protein [Cruoricaptor ignavus]|nr:DNA-binding domain-containing protein [Cruoricaptor ignavus]